MQSELVLRDIHMTAAPSWWPPAPGWWGVAILLLVVCALAAWLLRRSRRRRDAIVRLFDEAIANAPTPAAKVAQMSELLRRAAIRRDPAAGQLQGDDWLRFLDAGSPSPMFIAGVGRTLGEGGYRADTTQVEVDALQRVARDRFLAWMAVKR